ncbi:MAG: peptide-methionine (S)-S-oxide reductase MsrA [Candidatus Kapabacteria bacterium]|nr:peptide-methionine (S)-S-oxide reductase MsrA [Ignavibacteriota bacterium]MCW5884179.1 peptide-methionine (S)-S-oxide reductase MsrA [Candidatus Kapabacteria bacterium]
MKYKLIILIILSVIINSCSTKAEEKKSNGENEMSENLEYIILGGGCFWCVEAVFQDLTGVASVVSGYTGGKTKNPTYEDICTGLTGHAEVVKVGFNPEIISLEEILEVHFATHDPTTLNRQGADAGTQYRSAIFYINKNQEEISRNYIKLLTAEKVFEDKIVTEVTQLDEFYKAEDYHQNYFKNNPNQPYCMVVINPKVNKVRTKFKSKLKQ